jgi:hypothetical protein
MKFLRTYILILLFVVAWSESKSQEAMAWAKLDSAAIMIGDQIGMELGVKVPDKFIVQWPVIDDTITSHIEIVKMSSIDSSFRNGQLIMKQNLTITSFDSGYFEIPEFKFLLQSKNDTTKFEAATGALYLQVYTPEVDTAKPFVPIIKPIEEPYTFGEILPWILLGLTVLAIIILLIVYLNKRKAKQPLFGRKPKPLPPPDVEAITKLEELRHARVWQSGKVKEYYSQLTDIMRNYLNRRFGFDALEMTSDEIVEELANHQVNEEVKEKLKGMLMLADLVKFAKAQPTPLENDLSLDHSLDFVKETKPIEVVTEKANGDKKEETILSDKKEDK